jgi:transcriptional regulator with XRE-family HTH domain
MSDSRLSTSAPDAHLLVALRVARGLSRERLAQLAGVSSRTIFGIEREGHEPRRATAAVLAAVLGCDPDLLLNDLGPAADGPEAKERGARARPSE